MTYSEEQIKDWNFPPPPVATNLWDKQTWLRFKWMHGFPVDKLGFAEEKDLTFIYCMSCGKKHPKREWRDF